MPYTLSDAVIQSRQISPIIMEEIIEFIESHAKFSSATDGLVDLTTAETVKLTDIQYKVEDLLAAVLFRTNNTIVPAAGA